MRIGIDISQIAYEGTGVAQYVRLITEALIRTHPEHEYVLFGASLRKKYVFYEYVKYIPGTPRLVVVSLLSANHTLFALEQASYSTY